MSGRIFWKNPISNVCLAESYTYFLSVRVCLGEVHLEKRCLEQKLLKLKTPMSGRIRLQQYILPQKWILAEFLVILAIVVTHMLNKPANAATTSITLNGNKEQ